MTVNACDICGCIPPQVGNELFQQAALNLLCGILSNTTGGGVASAVNVNQVGGVAISLGQAAMAASVPVTIASDQDFVKAEDSPHASGDKGIMALAIRSDTAAAIAGTAGDYSPHAVNSVGAMICSLNMNYQVGAAASGSSPIVAEDSSVSEGSALILTGARRIDTLSTNPGSNGDAGFINQDSIGRLYVNAQGPVDQGTAVGSYPVVIGSAASSTNPNVSAGQVVRPLTDLIGRIVVANHGLPENTFYAVSSADITDAASTQVAPSAGASTRYYISAITVSNMHATVATRVSILDGATVVWSGPAAANGGGFTITFPQQIRCTAATALNAQCETAGAAVRVSIAGTTSTK